ncbi:MAG: hypothetical protein ASARMPRED_005356 [Alectoria sarmentosa]|nr:MAG: hypothetical protein ASARMPRED_005356 [Alectoria sarmentosa]
MSAKSNGAVTIFTTTSTYPSIPATGSRQLGLVTIETEITTTDSTGTANTETPEGNNNGGLAVSSMETGSSPTTTPSPATNGSPATATKSGAETTCSNISPSCRNNNNCYVDRFGLRYDIRCGPNFDDADVALQAHADAFEGCIQYCSLVKNCADVSCQDTNCYPIFTFRGYRPETAAKGTDLLTAIPTDVHNSGSITPDDLCADVLDGQIYTAKFQCNWEMLCDQTIGATPLQQTIQTNLEACIELLRVLQQL